MQPLLIENKKIFDLITINEEHQKNIDKTLDEMQRLETELNKLGLQKQKVRDKMQKLVAKEVGKLDEFVIVSSAVKEGDKVRINLIDLVEAYKEQLRAKYGQSNLPTTKEDDTSGETEKEVDAEGNT
jgi:hypothetical protein